MGSVRLTAPLVPRGPAAAVVLDDATVATVGEGAKQFPVAATVNGYVWRTTIFRRGGDALLGLSRAVREAAGVEPGDTVDVELVLDTAPREVEVPAALAVALDADPAVRATFDGLAFTHRKEFARWVEEAKREETRERRVRKAIEMLRAGQTRS